LFLGLFGGLDEAFAETFLAVTSGDWDSGATWRDGSGAGDPGVPGPGDTANIPNGITVTVQNDLTFSGLINNGGSLVIEATLTNNGFFAGGLDFGIINSGPTAELVIAPSGEIENNGLVGNFFGATMSIDGKFFNNFAGGNAHFHNEAEVILNGDFTNAGDVHQENNGNFRVFGTLTNTGGNAIWDNRVGSILDNADLTMTGQDAGTINNVFGATINNDGFIFNDKDGRIDNSDSSITGGIINNNSDGTIDNGVKGNITNFVGGIINNYGNFLNSADLLIEGGSFFNRAIFNNKDGGTFTNSGDFSASQLGVLNNAPDGTIEVSNDALLFSGANTRLINSGDINIQADGGISITFEAIMKNLSGGVINNFGDLDADEDGEIINESNGIINNESGATISTDEAGLIDNKAGGKIFNNLGGKIINNLSAGLSTRITNSGNIVNSGLIENRIQSLFINDSGGIIINLGTINNSDAINNSGKIKGCGMYLGTLPNINMLLPCTFTEDFSFTSDIKIPSGVTMTIEPPATVNVDKDAIFTIESGAKLLIIAGATFRHIDLGPGGAVCGNGVVDGLETCDDGNKVGGDGCSATCAIESCGNSVIDVGELCDDGNAVDDGNGCSSTCQFNNVCGNFIVEVIVEACDAGGFDTPTCDADCTTPVCGDGTVNFPAGELCDDGNNLDGDGCSSVCITE